VTGYEYRRFAPGRSEVSTFEFHEHRERAPHIDQTIHQPRLYWALQYVIDALVDRPHLSAPLRVVDLGCGDGGLISRLITHPNIDISGYDFQPSNEEGWLERGVLFNCQRLNFVECWDDVAPADLYVITEVLEHLEEPYEMLRRIRARDAQVVCSSPWMEHEGNIDGCHNWAWDMPGYVHMLEICGFRVVSSQREGIFQVHRAVPA